MSLVARVFHLFYIFLLKISIQTKRWLCIRDSHELRKKSVFSGPTIFLLKPKIKNLISKIKILQYIFTYLQ